MVIYATNPHSKKQVFVNALTGAVAGESELLHDQNTRHRPDQIQRPPDHHNRLHRRQQLPADRIDAGGGIETYNLQKEPTTDLPWILRTRIITGTT